MSGFIQTPTLRISGPDMDSGTFVVLATSYGREAPSGLGVFNTAEEAEAAMARLQAHLDLRKEPSKSKTRKFAA